MNSLRTHEHSVLYKHVSLSTAYAVLNSGCFRWSSPERFNDPFDIPEVLYNDFEPKELQRTLISRVKGLIDGTEDTSGRTLSQSTQLLVGLGRMAGEELKNELYESFSEVVDSTEKLPSTFSELREHWAENRKIQRILCLTCRWDSASMWDRYSSGHTGVVFELSCDDSIDSALIGAREVKYTDESLKISTLEGFIDYILFDPIESMKHMMEENTLTKTEDWSYEKEYRVVSWKRKFEEDGQFSDYEIHPNEAKSLILGAEMKEEDQEKLSTLARERFPAIEIWKAAKTTGRKLEKTRKE